MIAFEVAFAIMAAVVEGESVGRGENEFGLVGHHLWKKMHDTYHSVDDNHEGESIWVHSRRVYEQLGFSVDQTSLIERTAAWAAVIHDVGKVWTASYNEEKGKTTFYKHGNYSAAVAKAFMANIDRVPESMALIPDYPLVEMVKWHDAIISLQHDRKDDFTHMKKVYKPFENAAVRRAFLRLVTSDCQPRAADKKAVWAVNFSNDFVGYQHHLEIEEKVAKEKRYAEMLRFEESRGEIIGLVTLELGPDAADIVRNANSPQDIGRLFGQLGKAKKQHIIKQVKALYEVS